MAVIEIVFSAPHGEPGPLGSAEFPLFFNSYDTAPARKWMGFLKIEVAKEVPAQQHYLKHGKVRGRFVDFPSHTKGATDLANLINECIDKVNSYCEGAIPLLATSNATQQDLNELHKYFEILRGPRLDPGPLFAQGPDEVREALEDFNLLIHEFEAYNTATETEPGAYASVDITFESNGPRHPFGAEDYQYFDPARDFGGLYLHYCDVGKPLLDAYNNQDQAVSIGNIRPLEVLSADVDVFFGKPTKHLFDLQFKVEFNQWLRRVGLDPSDPKLSIGYLKVGQLIPDSRIKDLKQEAFLELMSPYLNVKRIAIHE